MIKVSDHSDDLLRTFTVALILSPCSMSSGARNTVEVEASSSTSDLVRGSPFLSQVIGSRGSPEKPIRSVRPSPEWIRV